MMSTICIYTCLLYVPIPTYSVMCLCMHAWPTLPASMATPQFRAANQDTVSNICTYTHGYMPLFPSEAIHQRDL